MKLERKTVALDLKAASGGEISGYASLFGQIDQGNDEVAPGAYTKSLAETEAAGRRVKMLWQHNPNDPIGVWDEVKEDKRGLHVKGRLLMDVARGREVASLIEAGAIDGLSIGYRSKDTTRGEKGQRVLKEINLFEVSLVTFPMQLDARIDAIKAADEFRDGNPSLLKRILDETLMDVGFSRQEAKAATAAAARKLATLREAGAGFDELRELLKHRA